MRVDLQRDLRITPIFIQLVHPRKAKALTTEGTEDTEKTGRKLVFLCALCVLCGECFYLNGHECITPIASLRTYAPLRA
jgi:hypothetical protein